MHGGIINLDPVKLASLIPKIVHLNDQERVEIITNYLKENEYETEGKDAEIETIRMQLKNFIDEALINEKTEKETIKNSINEYRIKIVGELQKKQQKEREIEIEQTEKKRLQEEKKRLQMIEQVFLEIEQEKSELVPGG